MGSVSEAKSSAYFYANLASKRMCSLKLHSDMACEAVILHSFAAKAKNNILDLCKLRRKILSDVLVCLAIQHFGYSGFAQRKSKSDELLVIQEVVL